MNGVSQTVAVAEGMGVLAPSVAASITTSAQTLAQLGATAAQLAVAKRATISVASACHLTYDGLTTPTSSVGHPLAAGSSWVLEGNAQINAAKLVSDASTIAGFITLEG